MATRKDKNIWDVAKASLKAAKNNKVKATKLMAKELREDRTLFRQCVDHIIEAASEYDVGLVLRQNRLAAWTAPNYDPGGKGSRVLALAENNLRMMMMFPLPGGKLLADALREDVAEAAEYYRDKQRDAGHKARWFALIAKHIPPKKTVSQSLSESQLRQLKTEAEHA